MAGEIARIQEDLKALSMQLAECQRERDHFERKLDEAIQKIESLQASLRAERECLQDASKERDAALDRVAKLEEVLKKIFQIDIVGTPSILLTASGIRSLIKTTLES